MTLLALTLGEQAGRLHFKGFEMNTEVHEEVHIKENFYVGKAVAWVFGIIGTLMAVGIIQLVGSLNSINQTLSRMDERFISQQEAIVRLESEKYAKSQALSDNVLINRDIADHEKRITELEKKDRTIR